MLKHINRDQFENEVTNSEGITLVDFFATWCGPCQMLSPVLEKIAEEKEELNIVKIDIDKETKLAVENGVEVVPTVLIFKDGKQVNRFEGFREEEEIINIINKVI